MSEKYAIGLGNNDVTLRKKADSDFVSFWDEQAHNLTWFSPWTHTLDWKPPFAKWFVGGTINASYNALDIHQNTKSDKPAILWEGENGDSKTYTYGELLLEVQKFSNVLKSLGVKKGDRVTIYLPMVPELPIAMLSCARIGAIHTVVFSGFSAASIKDRIEDSKSKIIITADGATTTLINNNIKVVIDYIKNKNPVVLCLNVNELIPKNCITAYVACHETRILIESDRYNELNVPIILPLNRIPESIRNVLDKAKIFDFGMAIKKNEFEIKNNDCILSSALSLFYAISVATAANANRILIAGADGYEINDPRYKEISDLFDKYDVLDNAISVYSITKTKYPIKQRSVYDPML